MIHGHRWRLLSSDVKVLTFIYRVVSSLFRQFVVYYFVMSRAASESVRLPLNNYSKESINQLFETMPVISSTPSLNSLG